MKKILYILLFCLLLNSCHANNYEILSDKIWDASKIHDLEKIKEYSEEITSKEIDENEGINYIKLKILTLTLLQDFDAFNDLTVKYKKLFDINYELLLSKSVIKNWQNIDASEDFNLLVQLLITNGLQDEQQLITLYYVLSIIEYPDESNLKIHIRNNITPSIIPALDYYDKTSVKDLLKSPLLGFVSNSGLSKPSDSKADWW